MQPFLLVLALAAQGAAEPWIFSPKDWDLVSDDTSTPPRKSKGAVPKAEASQPFQVHQFPDGYSLVAEFEEMKGVLVRYPLGIPPSLVALFSTDAMVHVLCVAALQKEANETLADAGAVVANLSFIDIPTDSYWTRDFGPWWVRDQSNASSIGVVDFTYNRPRPNDNNVTRTLAELWGLPYAHSGLTLTGGNEMNLGDGTEGATTLMFEENPDRTQEEVTAVFEDFYGLAEGELLTIQDPTGNYIEHMDCWGKFLSPTDVLVDASPATAADHDSLDEAAAWFGKQVSASGNPLTVWRTEVKGSVDEGREPYSNSLILNKRVFVPVAGGIHEADDKAALAVYQAALPDYEIIGVLGDPLHPWVSTDALHCRTRGVPLVPP